MKNHDFFGNGKSLNELKIGMYFFFNNKAMYTLSQNRPKTYSFYFPGKALCIILA